MTAETLSNIPVYAYDDVCTIHDVAQIIPKNDKTVLLNVYDPDIIDKVKRALDVSELDLNITSNQEGLLASLSNANSREAKEAFVKNLKNIHSNSLEELRSVRGEEIREIKGYEHFGKDDIYHAEKEIHEMYLEAAKEIENELKGKIDEIM